MFYCPPDQLSNNLVASKVPPVMMILSKKQPRTSVAMLCFSHGDSASNCQPIGATFHPRRRTRGNRTNLAAHWLGLFGTVLETAQCADNLGASTRDSLFDCRSFAYAAVMTDAVIGHYRNRTWVGTLT